MRFLTRATLFEVGLYIYLTKSATRLSPSIDELLLRCGEPTKLKRPEAGNLVRSSNSK